MKKTMKRSMKTGIAMALCACACASIATACNCNGGETPEESSSITSSESNSQSESSGTSESGSGSGSESAPSPEGEQNIEGLSVKSVSTAAILKQGASGGEVREVQRRLKLWGYYKGSVDGVFGAGTKAAVVSFQKKNGLKADGVVGKSTYKALGMTSSYEVLAGQSSQSGSSGQGTNGFSSSDVYLLAKTIYAEGRGEPYTGQVAIGAVVLNRVRDDAFPNTISGVVYQKHAFTAVTDGQINLTPNETAMKAARDAINGWDPTGGALYYYNPAVATSAWIFDRQTVTVIGKHVFAI